ncbi:MAG: transcriptional repressor [Ruminococcus sp.]|uniref:Fur family transcriptional regulator n=1 Tax=Ruminococcus sp. TaxID=41978 RepID=UPI002872C124|nr:transcriptional repressor [Ruminococcus sp.]MBQ3284713.1 transcriptional repressor [Ruminococcus sp.]
MPKYITKQRKILTDYLMQHVDENLSAGQIADALSDTVSKSAVYRNLADMEAEGKLHRVMGGGGREVIYRYSGSHACSESLHLSCKKCGKTVHMQKQLADSLVQSVAQNDDFAIDKGETVIYGVCAACQHK